MSGIRARTSYGPMAISIGADYEIYLLYRFREELRKIGSKTIPPRGPLPVTVPGTVDGWFELHRQFGRLPMKDLLAPAIRYAREGFPVRRSCAPRRTGVVSLCEDFGVTSPRNVCRRPR